MLYIRLHGLQLCKNQQKTCVSQRPYFPRSWIDREIVRSKWKESGFRIYCCYVFLEPWLNRLHQNITTIHYTKRIVRSRYLPGLGIPLDGPRFQPSSKQRHKVSGCFIQRTRTGRTYQVKEVLDLCRNLLYRFPHSPALPCHGPLGGSHFRARLVIRAVAFGVDNPSLYSSVIQVFTRFHVAGFFLLLITHIKGYGTIG